jgi:hypothetical protein
MSANSVVVCAYVVVGTAIQTLIGRCLKMTTQFEGPEKLLEIWFAQSPAHVPDAPDGSGKSGLRKVDRAIWEEMLEIVQCKVLSVIQGSEIDAYLLR